MSSILNISAYRFVALDDCQRLRERIHAHASGLGLRGTVLLAEEGINLFLAGPVQAVRDFVQWLRSDDRFADLNPKESLSDGVPFRRLKVKVKREIIRMNQPTIRPHQGRAPAVDAPTLARWLEAGHDDQGRPVVTLDTRNTFEVDHGTFDGAIDWRLAKFSDFPKAAKAHRDELVGKTVVSFCTGGIRCEKAALYLRECGLEHIYQLDGGILKYFELMGSRHFHGGCFVFDERQVLAADLQPLKT
ncbi:sulfurtransferase [Caldimonas manganoxidans]|uniref:sulfurtransferase n=1 Tax=Caldimonas manganoxidans TaxID=196015 RepID=UPI000365CAC8|nr:sulfurtransferase [Caldimonas manganoxidans]